MNLVHILVERAFAHLFGAVPLRVNVGIHPIHLNSPKSILRILTFLLFLLLLLLLAGRFIFKVGDQVGDVYIISPLRLIVILKESRVIRL
jgi:hypothetical protein